MANITSKKNLKKSKNKNTARVLKNNNITLHNKMIDFYLSM